MNFDFKGDDDSEIDADVDAVAAKELGRPRHHGALDQLVALLKTVLHKAPHRILLAKLGVLNSEQPEILVGSEALAHVVHVNNVPFQAGVGASRNAVDGAALVEKFLKLGFVDGLVDQGQREGQFLDVGEEPQVEVAGMAARLGQGIHPPEIEMKSHHRVEGMTMVKH